MKEIREQTKDDMVRLKLLKLATARFNEDILDLMKIVENLETEKTHLEGLLKSRNVTAERMEKSPIGQYDDIEKLGKSIINAKEKMQEIQDVSVKFSEDKISSFVNYNKKKYTVQEIPKNSHGRDNKKTAEQLKQLVINETLPKSVIMAILQIESNQDWNNIKRYWKDLIIEEKEKGKETICRALTHSDLDYEIPKVVNFSKK